MKGFLKQIFNWLRKVMPKKKPTLIMAVILGVVILSICILWPHQAGAQGFLDDVYRGIIRAFAELLLSLGELCIRLSVFFLSFFIALARWNNYIDVPIVMLGWTMVRDVANMFFVVILLIIAIGTILGLEQYQWNKTLVKMILAAVFINFSNLICGLMIDVAHVFTITFVNAIAATAGGNLINMFHLNDLFTLVNDSAGDPKNDLQDMDIRLFAAAAASFLFAFLALITIAVYTIVMVFRVIMLWILVILSPIAYITSVLPQSQSYSKEWWDEFGRYVLVAPLMVFFLWLAFATMGDGQVISSMALQFSSTEGQYSAEELGSKDITDSVASLAKITEWANLANLIIPICLLWAGLERVQKLGVRGGGMISKGMDFFKNVATIATGYAAGRWLARGTTELGKKVGKGALYHAPLVGGQAWVERAKLVSGRFKDAWYAGAAGKAPLDKKDYLGRAFRATLGWNFGIAARGTARRRKRIKAAEGSAEAAESLLGKQQSAAQWGNRSRTRRGQLEAYEERSKNRDAEGIQSAKVAALSQPRMKDGKAYVNPETGEVSSLAGEAARFALRKEALEDEQKGMMGDERKKIIDRAKPDIEKAAVESDQVREQRKSEELLKAEEAEKSAQKTFRESEAKIKVDVDAEIKKDEGGIISSAQKELDEAKKNEKLVDTGLVKLKQDSDYSKLVEDREERKKAEESKKRVVEQLKSAEGADKDKLEKKKQAEEAKIAKLDASILANTKGKAVEEDVKEKEEEKQKAKNAAEKAQKKIKERTDEIAGNVEKKAVTSDGTTIAQQRDAYTRAQAKTIEAKKAWEQTLKEAEESPTTTVTADERERAKAIQDVLQQVAADVESKIKKDEIIVEDKETLTDREKEVAKYEEELKGLKAKKLAVAPPSSPEEKANRAKAKAELEADDKLGKFKGQSVDELLKELYEKHGWSQDKDAENRVFVQAYIDASKEEKNASLDAQIANVEKDIARERGFIAAISEEIDERREQITKEIEAKPVQIVGEEAPVPIEQLRKENIEAQKKVAVADQLERDRVAKERLKEIEKGLFEGELTTKNGETVMANGKAVKRSDSNIAIAYLKAKQRAAATGASVESAETDAQKIMLGLESFHSLFSSEVASKMGAEASKAFIDGIKEKKNGELFKRGALELQAALEKGGASLEKLSLNNVGARMAQAQMISEYNKDIAGANKSEAADHAESIFTAERYGFKTPSSAFKDWVKKQTERLQGVEREQSVKNAMGTVSQFFKLQKQGKEISTDQRAQMMAHLKHLTSNGWMDDLLAGIAKKSTMKASLFGEEREEAEALESEFFDKLHWDPTDNRSGADRTAQVQKLVAMGGDNDNMQGEELVLWIKENTGKTYSEANKQAAAVTHENAKIILDEKTTRDAKAQIAIKAGALTEDQLAKAKADPKDFKANAAVDAGIDQLMAYTRKFALPAESAEKAAAAFKKSMEKFQDAFEMLADFKNLGMNTGHIDDGGHTYYDMDEGMVRGNLGHNGKAFTLGEWRKLGLDQRLSRLKTHSIGQMQEDYQTIDYTAGEESDDAIRETFAGLSNQREFAKVDGRNKDHIAGMASGEAIRQDAGGRTKIGDDDSVYFKGTFSHIADQDERRRAVAKRLRGNYAAFLRNNPAALLGSLAERSGLSFDDGMEGNINVNICGETISSVEELVRWVNSDPDGKFNFNPEHIRRSLARAKRSRNSDD